MRILLFPDSSKTKYYEKNRDFKFIGADFRGLRRRDESAERRDEPAGCQHIGAAVRVAEQQFGRFEPSVRQNGVV